MKVARSFSLSLANAEWIKQTSNQSAYIDNLVTADRVRRKQSEPMSDNEYTGAWIDLEKQAREDARLAQAQEEMKLLNVKLDEMNRDRDAALAEGNEAKAEEIKLEMLKLSNPKRAKDYVKKRGPHDEVLL